MASSFLGVLSSDDRLKVMRHPAQRHNVYVVESLICDLRACRTYDQYDDFQRELFQYLYHREEHRAECRRCAGRLRRGRPLPTSLPQLPPGADPHDPETWRIEDVVLDRICRQLRAVGDALAWRASGYDRRYVIALSSNASAGVMAGKIGLPVELGVATELRQRGSFPLLHDLTNCLRIGDITEIKPDGSKLLYEVKSNPAARASAQRRRMKAALEAVMTGGELPGRPGQRIVSPTRRCRTHITTFVSTIDAAIARGTAGAVLDASRVMSAFSSLTLGKTRPGSSPQHVLQDFEAERRRAVDRAGIANVLHHVQVASATRNHDFVPSVTPFALFPLAPRHAALLLCDYIGFSITLAPERIAERLERLGFTAHIPLETANTNLVATDTVINLRRGSRGVQLHPGALYEFLVECLDLESWAMAIAEVLDDPSAPRHPVIAFSTTRVWR